MLSGTIEGVVPRVAIDDVVASVGLDLVVPAAEVGEVVGAVTQVYAEAGNELLGTEHGAVAEGDLADDLVAAVGAREVLAQAGDVARGKFRFPDLGGSPDGTLGAVKYLHGRFRFEC